MATRCMPPTLRLDANPVQPNLPTSATAVVESQLAGLQRGDVQAFFDSASTRVRRVSGPRQRFEKIVRSAPALRPLIDSEGFNILSALQIGPHAWQYRVRVENTIGSISYSVDYMMKVLQHTEGAISYDLGQCFVHREHGFRGVIIGYDARCEAPLAWQRANRVHELEKAGEQPFYSVLMDGSRKSYVPQEIIEPTGTILQDRTRDSRYMLMPFDRRVQAQCASTTLTLRLTWESETRSAAGGLRRRCCARSTRAASRAAGW